MSVWWKITAVLVAAALLIGAIGLTAQHLKADSGNATALQAARDSVAELSVRNDSLARRVARGDTAERRDTTVLVTERVRYVAVHDTVLRHLTDTLIVREFVHAADSTIHACTRALADCATQVAERDSLIALARAQITQWQRVAQAEKPPLLRRPGVDIGYSTLGPTADIAAGFWRANGLVGYTVKGGVFAGVTVRVTP